MGANVQILINSWANIGPVNGLRGDVLAQIKDRLTFPNPSYLENKRRGFSNWQTPREICGYRIEGDSLSIPRGFSRQLVGVLRPAPGKDRAKVYDYLDPVGVLRAAAQARKCVYSG